ncbi:transposase [Nonomuraea angiospora]|uniref:Mutator family transposase n=1 Tax=Nonomuraea angiospora TaxID=46172 RepID=A0ABR9MFA4_9ACTN|nr:transposase [Nonomuraea angiospora]MBE1591587.1 transposase-like protein [Nonomuraea angiospora]
MRGLSVRDVEGALADALGPEAALSKSTVSTICQAIVAEYDAWCRRDLTHVDLDYLFLDASHFKMHDGSRAEPILAARGITTAGKPVFVGLAAAAAESTDAWHDFLSDLVARGLRPPLLIISDGAPGLISAAEQVFPTSLRQRCLVHRARNVLAKVSAGDQAEVKAAYWQIFDLSEPGDDITAGQGLVDLVQRRIDAFADTWSGRYPAAVKCLLTDRQSLTSKGLRILHDLRRALLHPPGAAPPYRRPGLGTRYRGRLRSTHGTYLVERFTPLRRRHLAALVAATVGPAWKSAPHARRRVGRVEASSSP